MVAAARASGLPALRAAARVVALGWLVSLSIWALLPFRMTGAYAAADLALAAWFWTQGRKPDAPLPHLYRTAAWLYAALVVCSCFARYLVGTPVAYFLANRLFDAIVLLIASASLWRVLARRSPELADRVQQVFPSDRRQEKSC